MDERSRKIAAGLAAAEKGKQDLASANERAEVIMREARERAAQIVDQAQHRANDMVEEAKGTATAEGAAAAGAGARSRSTSRPRMRARACGAMSRRSPSRAAATMLEREIDARRRMATSRQARGADLGDPMAEKTTIARPYAKAAFQEAQADKAICALVARGCAPPPTAVRDPRVHELLGSPSVSGEDLAQFVMGVTGADARRARAEFFPHARRRITACGFCRKFPRCSTNTRTRRKTSST